MGGDKGVGAGKEMIERQDRDPVLELLATGSRTRTERIRLVDEYRSTSLVENWSAVGPNLVTDENTVTTCSLGPVELTSALDDHYGGESLGEYEGGTGGAAIELGLPPAWNRQRPEKCTARRHAQRDRIELLGRAHPGSRAVDRLSNDAQWRQQADSACNERKAGKAHEVRSAWRERMGIEPTQPDVVRSHWF